MAIYYAILLLVSWLICWYFFFVRYAQRGGDARGSVRFVITTSMTVAALGAWSVVMWVLPPHTVASALVVIAAELVLVGQWLMVASRKALPLSNYEVLMQLSQKRIRTGVYKHLAHPMYVGLMLALLGSSLLLGNALALEWVLVIGGLLMLRLSAESY